MADENALEQRLLALEEHNAALIEQVADLEKRLSTVENDVVPMARKVAALWGVK